MFSFLFVLLIICSQECSKPKSKLPNVENDPFYLLFHHHQSFYLLIGRSSVPKY